MRVRHLLVIAFASLSVASMTAVAHEGHDEEEKPMPTTCAQLADTKRYSNDVAYPQIKALKARCDAEKKAREKSAAPKPAAKSQ